MTLLGAKVLIDVPRRDAPVKGEITRVGYPALVIEPHKAYLEMIDGRPVHKVIRAVWDVEITELGEGLRHGTA